MAGVLLECPENISQAVSSTSKGETLMMESILKNYFARVHLLSALISRDSTPRPIKKTPR